MDIIIENGVLGADNITDIMVKNVGLEKVFNISIFEKHLEASRVLHRIDTIEENRSLLLSNLDDYINNSEYLKENDVIKNQFLKLLLQQKKFSIKRKE